MWVYETKNCSKCGWDKRPEEFRLVNARRHSWCKECKSAAEVDWARRNREKAAAKRRRWYERHRDRKLENNRRWQLENRDRVSAINARWVANNRGTCNVNNRLRKADRRKRTPAWADREQLKAIYAEAVRNGMHVDHVIPLHGELVSGLHVPGNLQLLPPMENIRKSNRFEIN